MKLQFYNLENLTAIILYLHKTISNNKIKAK